MRKRLLLALLPVLVVATAVTTTATPASAAPPGCPRGYFCMYYGEKFTGNVIAVAGNFDQRTEGIRSVYNNGYAYPGYDHINLTFHGRYLFEEVCIHYAPGPGQYSWSSFPSGSIVVMWSYWRGECQPGEDVIH